MPFAGLAGKRPTRLVASARSRLFRAMPGGTFFAGVPQGWLTALRSVSQPTRC